MILTCPECATRYFVDDARIGAKGREVRCASCGNRWTATKEDDALVLEPGLSADSPVTVAEAAPAAPSLPPEAVPADELPAEVLPKVYRQRAQTIAKERQAAATGVIWAALLGGFVVLVGAAVLLRQDIAQIWPRTAGAYAMIGLPVNLVGLTIEGQHAQPMLKDGHADLAVSGTLRNVRGRPVAAPPLKVSLLAADGRVVATQIAKPDGVLIPAGETRRFVVDLLDPPVSAANVEIGFVFQGRIPKGKATASPAAPTVTGSSPPTAIDLRGAAGPAAEEAKPVPSSSPYALPATAMPSSPNG